MKKEVKKDEGMVSVIIPTYNRSQQCREALLSVLSQSYQNIEAIIVDDGSTDNTRELVENIDRRVVYIWQRNSGVSSARNTGLKAARGEYIAFLDSDDLWMPYKLEVQLTILKYHNTSGMVWSDMVALDDNKNILSDSYLTEMYHSYSYFDREYNFRQRHNIKDIWDGCPKILAHKKCYSGNIFSNMFMGNLVHTSTVLLTRERQKKVGNFDTNLIKSGEDYDFHFRTCRFGDVSYIDAPLICYRIGADDQLTEKKNMYFMARNNLITITRMLSVARNEIQLPWRMIRKQLAWSYAWLGMEEFKQNNYKSARSSFAKSIELEPQKANVLIYYLLTYFSMKNLKKLFYIKETIKNIMVKNYKI